MRGHLYICISTVLAQLFVFLFQRLYHACHEWYVESIERKNMFGLGKVECKDITSYILYESLCRKHEKLQIKLGALKHVAPAARH